MTAGDDEIGGIVWVGRAEGAGVAHDAGIKLAVGGAHRELETVQVVIKTGLLIDF
jgi:hypothetical protein